MYSYFNCNPKGNRVGDCVIRAISKALNQSWEDTYIDLTIQGYLMGDLLSSNAVWGAYLKSKNFICRQGFLIFYFCLANIYHSARGGFLLQKNILKNIKNFLKKVLTNVKKYVIL